MKVIHAQTSEPFDVVVEKVTAQDLKRIRREKKFGFSWSASDDCELYKLELATNGEILGLMAIRDKPEPGFRYIELVLIEVNKSNTGRSKQYRNIAGILIAYACREAFSKGYDGHVILKPKTVLWNHYVATYGFVPITKWQLAVAYENSQSLVKKYLNE